jgi:hypothetical protein
MTQEAHENSKDMAGSQSINLLLDGLEQEMSAFTAAHHEALKELQRFYVFPTDASVESFLADHRTVPQILLEAAGPLREIFGAGTIFVLRAPIDTSGSRTLYAVAMWPGKVVDVRTALSKFDEGWWIARVPQASGRLAFTYELI